MELPEHYSLHSEEEGHFVVHDGRDNKTFQVSKKELHPATQIKIMKMRKYSDGDDQEADDEGTIGVKPPTPAEVAAPDQVMTPMPQPPVGSIGQIGAETPGAVPRTEGNSVIPTGADGITPGTDLTKVAPWLGYQKASIEAMNASQQGLSKDVQGAILTNQVQNIASAEMEKQAYDSIGKEMDTYKKDVLSRKINPHQYFDNMKTGQRVQTALALILGGIGSGLTHGPNLALQMIDKAMDQDIQEQKDAFGRRDTLFSLNMKKYHDDITAEAATRLRHNQSLQLELQAAQAKATSGASLAALNMGMASLAQNEEALKRMIAERVGNMHSLGLGTGKGGVAAGGPEDSALALGQHGKDYLAKRVVVDGVAHQANDENSAHELRTFEGLATPIVSAVNTLEELSKDPTAHIEGFPANEKVVSTMNYLAQNLPLLTMAKVNGKRVSTDSAARELERLHDPTKVLQAFGSGKMDVFFEQMKNDIDSMRTNNLVNYVGGVKGFKSAQPITGKISK